MGMLDWLVPMTFMRDFTRDFTVGNKACQHSTPIENQLPDGMVQALAPLLEFGERPVRGAECKTATACSIDEIPCSLQYGQHVPGIVLPIGGQMQTGAGLEFACNECYKSGLDQATLVMALSGPGIWKENLDTIQAGVR